MTGRSTRCGAGTGRRPPRRRCRSGRRAGRWTARDAAHRPVRVPGSGQGRTRFRVRYGFRSRGDRGRVGARHGVGARGCRRGRARRWGGRRWRRGRLRARRGLWVRHRVGVRLRALGIRARGRRRRHGVGNRVRHQVLQPVGQLRLWTTPPPTRPSPRQSLPGRTGRGPGGGNGATGAGGGGNGRRKRPGGPSETARVGPQNRPGWALSQSFAAASRSGSAGEASSGWRSAHLVTYGQSEATAPCSRPARA